MMEKCNMIKNIFYWKLNKAAYSNLIHYLSMLIYEICKSETRKNMFFCFAQKYMQPT
jgi:hypothetical protein